MEKEKNKTVAIIANGETVTHPAALDAIREAGLVIAADGGAKNCLLTGITPDHIIGDFDSLPENARQVFPAGCFIHDPDQYSTDMEKALRLALRFHPGRILVISAFGGRMDHATANLLFLAEINRTLPVELLDNHGRMMILNPGKHSPRLSPGDQLSLFSMVPVKGLSLLGFRYPLENESYEPFFVGISNLCQEAGCMIEFESGILYLYHFFGSSGTRE